MQRKDNLRKTLPIYYLVDTGSQMTGDKIGSVNAAIEEAITVDLPEISAANNDAEIRVAIIQFSDGASWVTPGAVPLGDVIWNDLHASSANDFGQALHLLAVDLKSFDPHTMFAPIVVAFSNATVSDDYTGILKQLGQMECFRRGHKIGIMIGSGADKKALETFTGSSNAVLAVNDKHAIKALIRKTDIEEKSMIDLKSILSQHPNCLSSRASFKSILMDKYPAEKRTVNILTILFECGVAHRIKEKKNIDSNEMSGLVAQVENEYGISGQYSQEAILIWAAAFGVTASAIKTQSPITAPKEQAKPVEQKPVVYVQGDVDDYDVVRKTDGYYITHFNGFEEDEMTIPSMIDGKPIKGIAQDAFKGCVAVKRITISEGIEIIENCAFKDCKALEEITLPDTLRRIGSKSAEYGVGAFGGTNLKSVILPQNVEFLGPYSFSFCSNLRKVELSDKITVIHESTFNYCRSLSDIKLPSGLLRIEANAFDNCKALRVVHIPLGTQFIGRKSFDGTNLAEIYIPPTVTKIGEESTRSILGDGVFGYSSRSLTIYCAAGSMAMEYARKNNIKCAKAQF